MKRWVLVPCLLFVGLLCLACGGQSNNDPDRQKLDELAKGLYEGPGFVGTRPAEFGPALETRLAAILRFAAENSNKPIGREAFELAETAYLQDRNQYRDQYNSLINPANVSNLPFVSRAPVPPDLPFSVTDDNLATYVGFVTAVPEPYRSEKVLGLIEKEVRAVVKDAFDNLQATVDSRMRWVRGMRDNSSSTYSYSGGTYTASREYDEMAQLLTYVRRMAPSAEVPPQMLPALDALIDAAGLAQYEPRASGGPSDVNSKSGQLTVVNYYSEADVLEAEQHAKELSAAVKIAARLITAIPAATPLA